jgi:hypothetical protein
VTAPDEAQRRLHFADRLLREPNLVEDGVWPRACTWLIRLAIEHAVDAYWSARRPEVLGASRRITLLALALAEPELGQQVAALWYALSRAAHHHAYELAPTATELRSWHTEGIEVVLGLARRTSK